MYVIPLKIIFFILLIVAAELSGDTQPKPFYKEDEYPDIHSSNFGYTKDGILKFLDI